MDSSKFFGILLLAIWLIGFIWGLVYWGNLAWRHPTKLKEVMINQIERWFNWYLWMYRIMTLIFGLLLLFFLLIVILSLLGIMK